MKYRYTKEKNFPPFLDQIIKMKPEDVPVSAYARILCTHCGLFNRAILCPPLLYKTYPQYTTIDTSRSYIDSFRHAFIYVFKNDGLKRFWYKKEQDKFDHLQMKRRRGRELKGVEANSARQLTRIMKKVKVANIKAGYKADCYIQGHCDLCARKCPNRNNPPCKRGGLTAMEAAGINVYGLLDQLGIDYCYPVGDYLTQVTMLLVGEK